MENDLQQLIDLVPPPVSPRHSSGDWRGIEDQLNLKLPIDFKLLTKVYGDGQFCDNFGLLNPFAVRSMRSTIAGIISDWEYLRDFSDEEYSSYPAAGGLIPCGGNINANYLFWLPRDQPEDWSLIVWDISECKYHHPQHRSLPAFLLDLMSHPSPLQSLLLPSLAQDPGREPWFTSWEIDPETGTAHKAVE